MVPFGKARRMLTRWLRGNEDATSIADRVETTKDELSFRYPDYEQRIHGFLEDLKANSQEWLGRVRLVNLDSIKERVGITWPKLQGRVEILAERIIQGEMVGKDQCLNLGGAEFLVFFADATPEESRIRCLAIVEEIHTKLFGPGDDAAVPLRRFAECHVIHRDDLLLTCEGAAPNPSESDHPLQGGVPPRLFRQDAEILEGADIGASMEFAIDSIISRGAEIGSKDELTPLLVRLKCLSRSLKILESALATANREGVRQNPQGSQSIDRTKNMYADDHIKSAPFRMAWQDIAELVSVLDVGPDCSHADLVSALEKLQRARLARAAKAVTEEDTSASRLGMGHAETREFEYAPVYRSVSRGERIHQGVYRVTVKRRAEQSDDEVIGPSHQEAAALERLILDHAIQYCANHEEGARFVLMVPVHAETLRAPNSLRQYSTILRAARLRAKRRLVIEVHGYRDTDDTIGVRRAIDELRVHSSAIFVVAAHKSIDNLEKIAAECMRLRVHALGVDVSRHLGGVGKAFGVLGRISSVAEQYTIPTYVNGINSVDILAKAIASGVCYVCAPALRPARSVPGCAESATLDDLYSSL